MAGFATGARTGLAKGIYNLMGVGGANGQIDPYKQATEMSQGQFYDAKTRGQNISNAADEYVNRLTQDPVQVNNAAAYAADTTPENVAAYDFNRRFGLGAPQLDKTKPHGLVASEAAGITPQQAQSINGFMLNRYGGLTNPKGANDFMEGLKTDVARQANARASAQDTDPNAAVMHAGGKAYEPYTVDGNVVINKGTGTLGATTAIGQASIDKMGNPTDSPTPLMKELIALGVKPGSPEWNKALQASIRKSNYIAPPSDGKPMTDYAKLNADLKAGRITKEQYEQATGMKADKANDFRTIRDDIRSDYNAMYPVNPLNGKRQDPSRTIMVNGEKQIAPAPDLDTFTRGRLKTYNINEADFYKTPQQPKANTGSVTESPYQEYLRMYNAEKDPAKKLRMTQKARQMGIAK